MPRLGSFLVCEKIIQDQLAKPTIVSVFQKVSVVVPDGQELPKDLIITSPWAMFTEWFFMNEELPRRWALGLEVLMPDGSPSPIRGRVDIKELAQNGQGTRVYLIVNAMPVAQAGFLSANVWLERDSERLTEVFSYKILIEHTTTPPAADLGAVFMGVVPAPKPVAD
jgi:hypothetical protein